MSKEQPARARVVRALGEHRMIPIAKDDVVAYLASTDWEPIKRELLYRSWAGLVGCPIYRSDLERVRQARRRECNRALPLEAIGE